MPSVGNAILNATIKAAYPNDNIALLQLLPKHKSILYGFSKKRKHSRIDNFDPLSPPEKIFVSFNF
jgi:hypothetical protein